MKQSTPFARTLRFGVFELDPRAGELRKQGMKIRLQGQPIDILALLLERPGEVVTREELQKRLWPADTFVDFEQGLNAAIKRLRVALGDEAENPRFIETLPRHGYRFIVSVDGKDLTPATKVPPIRGLGLGLRLLAFGTLAAIALAAVLLGLNVRGVRDRLRGSSRTAQIRSIAVLPLENLSGDPQQGYFADGMTDALITELGKIGALRVISRQSVMHYKSSQKTSHDIARELGVDALVEGSVQRSGERVRVTANLIEASTDRHLWAEIYDRDLRDVLTVQRDFAVSIAREVRATLTPQEHVRLASTRHVEPKAYEAYLKGLYYSNKGHEENARKGIEYFRQALAADPGYALAYVGVAEGYYTLSNLYLPSREAMPEVKGAAVKALEIDDSLGEAHTWLAVVEAFYDWDWSAAEREFKRAVELNPGYGPAHLWYGSQLSIMGRHQEALAETQRATEVDPLSLSAHTFRGVALYFAGQGDAAIEEYRKALELDPNFFPAVWGLGRAYQQKGLYNEAIAEYQKTVAFGGGPRALAVLAQGYAVSGRRSEARKILGQLRARSSKRFVSAYEVATVYVGLGEKDQAFAWLEKAYTERAEDLVELKVDPLLDRLRADPRFTDLLRRMGLPP